MGYMGNEMRMTPQVLPQTPWLQDAVRACKSLCLKGERFFSRIENGTECHKGQVILPSNLAKTIRFHIDGQGAGGFPELLLYSRLRDDSWHTE